MPVGERCFSLLQNAQTVSEAYVASYSMDTGVVFREVAALKRPGCDHLHLAPRLRIRGAIPLPHLHGAGREMCNVDSVRVHVAVLNSHRPCSFFP